MVTFGTMRCLGRLVSLVLLLLLLAVGWLYRDSLHRWVDGLIDPMSVVRRTGAASRSATASARQKVARLRSEHPDSILLTPAEMAGLMLDGLGWSDGTIMDSVTIELGDRTVRLEGQLVTAELSAPLRSLIGHPVNLRERLALAGTLTPARDGVAEWRLERVSLHGFPVPASLVERVLAEAGVRSGGGRLEVGLPHGIGGFRVRPEGVALYRGAKP